MRNTVGARPLQQWQLPRVISAGRFGDDEIPLVDFLMTSLALFLVVLNWGHKNVP